MSIEHRQRTSCDVCTGEITTTGSPPGWEKLILNKGGQLLRVIEDVCPDCWRAIKKAFTATLDSRKQT